MQLPSTTGPKWLRLLSTPHCEYKNADSFPIPLSCPYHDEARYFNTALMHLLRKCSSPHSFSLNNSLHYYKYITIPTPCTTTFVRHPVLVHGGMRYHPK